MNIIIFILGVAFGVIIRNYDKWSYRAISNRTKKKVISYETRSCMYIKYKDLEIGDEIAPSYYNRHKWSFVIAITIDVDGVVRVTSYPSVYDPCLSEKITYPVPGNVACIIYR